MADVGHGRRHAAAPRGGGRDRERRRVSESSLFQRVDEEKSFHVLVDVAPEAHVGL